MILQSIIVEGFSFCEEIKLFPARKFYKRTKPKIIIYPPPPRRLSAHITSTRIELRNGGKIVYCLSTQYRDHTMNHKYFLLLSHLQLKQSLSKAFARSRKPSGSMSEVRIAIMNHNNCKYS